MMKKYFLTHPDNNSLTFQTCKNSVMFKYLLLRALAGPIKPYSKLAQTKEETFSESQQ